MPTFIDHHPTTVPPEMQDIVRNKIQSGEPDEFGSKGINVLFNESESWCLTESPSAESVHKSHEAIGIHLGPGDVQQVTSLV